MITCEVSGQVAEIVIAKPPTNALSIADLHTLQDMFQVLSADSSVSVVVLRSDGVGFSSGIDFKEFQVAHGRELLLDSGLACRDLFSAVRTCSVPVVVAVQGYCRGAAVALVASCDIVAAATDAHFALPEGSWSIAHFARMLPPARLRQVALACQVVTAGELHGYGSVHHLVEAPVLARTVREVAQSLCGQPRRNLVATKARLNHLDPFDADARFWQEQAFVHEASAEDLRVYQRATQRAEAD